MKSVEWKTYRTRFLVKAKQLSSSLSFVDHLGRQHCGRKGDYLVESCDGVLSIAPRQIFEDIYVPMPLAGDLPANPPSDQNEISMGGRDRLGLEDFQIEPLKIERIKGIHGDQYTRSVDPAKVSRAHRKSPQPVRGASPRLGLM
ncbi:MAG TPA: hypothetical protein VE377_10665 [Candidatus Dormibacteraeota bacterium]|nr:hypothetical protein [Candidatus Dormibacteraeota bacterium]